MVSVESKGEKRMVNRKYYQGLEPWNRTALSRMIPAPYIYPHMALTSSIREYRESRITRRQIIIISNVVDTFVKENKELFFLKFDADERFSNFSMSVVETLLVFFGRDGF